MRRLAFLLLLSAAATTLWARTPQGQSDAFGYRVEDSTTPFCGYQWVAAVGPALSFAAPFALLGDPPASDDGGAVVALALPFEFYGHTYSSFVVSPNGYVAFADALEKDDGRDFSNDPVGSVPTYQFASGSPRFAVPGRLLAYHDDLEVGPGGKVVASFLAACPRVSESLGVEPCTVVSWEGMRRAGVAESFTFQAVLYHQSGQLTLQYQGVDGTGGGSASVGIQDHLARSGLAYHFNTPGGLVPNASVCFFSPRFPPGGPVADLELLAETNDPLPASGPFDVPLHLGNFGPSPAENTLVTATLPAGVSYAGDSCGGEFADGQWSVGLLPERQGAICTLSLVNNAGGTVLLSASSAAADPDAANNSVRLELPVADDGDGVAREVEDSYPGGDGKPPFAKGDGNGDGIPDAQQPHVATLPLAARKGYLTVEIRPGCGQLQSVSTLTEASVSLPDRDYDFPHGLVSFTIPCSQAQVKMLFHFAGPIDRTYRATGANLAQPWVTLKDVTYIRERAVFGVVLPLEENEPGDRDRQGGIQHLGGPARRALGGRR